MKHIHAFSILLFAFVLVGAIAFAQDLPYRLSEKDVEVLLDRLEKATDEFESNVDETLDDSAIDDTSAEDGINKFIDAFEDSTDRLESNFDEDRSDPADVEEVLDRAAAIDRFLMDHRLSSEAMDDWAQVRTILDELATAYDVSWGWMALSEAPSRMSEEEVEDLLERLESNADRFKDSLDDALDESDVDGSRLEDKLNAYMQNFEQATDRLEDAYDEEDVAPELVYDVLQQGAGIDRFVSRYIENPKAEDHWNDVRTDLDRLARGYNLAWRWRSAVRDLED